MPVSVKLEPLTIAGPEITPNTTASPDEAVALSVIGENEKAWLAGPGKLIVWEALTDKVKAWPALGEMPLLAASVIVKGDVRWPALAAPTTATPQGVATLEPTVGFGL